MFYIGTQLYSEIPISSRLKLYLIYEILEDGVYGHRTANHTNIVKFFQKVNGKKLIDMLVIDVEGAEFGILDKLIG